MAKKRGTLCDKKGYRTRIKALAALDEIYRKRSREGVPPTAHRERSVYPCKIKGCRKWHTTSELQRKNIEYNHPTALKEYARSNRAVVAA